MVFAGDLVPAGNVGTTLVILDCSLRVGNL